jgi:hypothetical protein
LKKELLKHFCVLFSYYYRDNEGDSMKNKICELRNGLIISLGLIIVLSAIDASAWGGHWGGARAEFRGGYYGGYYHGYYGAGPYWPYWYGFAPCIGTFVGYLPYGYTTVLVDGTPYYYYGGYYFSPYSNGYMIVPEPESAASATSQDQGVAPVVPPASPAGANKQTMAAQPKSASGDTTIINVPNSKGGFTPVRLIKYKNGYVGPQGEFYAGHPTVDALKALYGD